MAPDLKTKCQSVEQNSQQNVILWLTAIQGWIYKACNTSHEVGRASVIFAKYITVIRQISKKAVCTSFDVDGVVSLFSNAFTELKI